ncbi:hypothetical protein B0H63DRAFT_486980 [Podospora didyma]|uniref:Extracellular membrane protein CFEM domain-containing protein n=1 Tax=Podospora didyma TaxID=330526 RepID=A0AAE0K6M3_9PEZI|nr:hypothetical protein B0H63DRAFT_486980 [Podospora didyma]
MKRIFIFAHLLFSLTAAAATISPLVPILTEVPTVPTGVGGCSGGITSFQACSSFATKQKECLGKGSETNQLACMCTQEAFNFLRLCENEVRLCLQSPMLDSDFEKGLADWHARCDSRLGTAQPVTTPPLASLTTTWDPDECTKYVIVCESAAYETSRCSSTVTAALDFVSCVCQPKITSLYSSCWYDGSINCAMESAALEDIPGYAVCPRFRSGITSHAPAEVSAALSVFHWTAKGGGVSPTTTSPPGTSLSLPTLPIRTSIASSAGGAITTPTSLTKPAAPTLDTTALPNTTTGGSAGPRKVTRGGVLVVAIFLGWTLAPLLRV